MENLLESTDNYKAEFSGKSAQESKAAKALSVALDIRKFEIDLYWKRATYFWVFTGAALAAHLAALTGKDVESRGEALLVTACIGMVFSLAWYLVNRSSKFWQSNWEAHVDILEDEVQGPLYKTVLSDSAALWKIHAAYPFSVSRINQLLSFFVFVLFCSLLASVLNRHFSFSKEWQILPTACCLLTGLSLASFLWLGRTNSKYRTVSNHRRRTHVSN